MSNLETAIGANQYLKVMSGRDLKGVWKLTNKDNGIQGGEIWKPRQSLISGVFRRCGAIGLRSAPILVSTRFAQFLVAEF